MENASKALLMGAGILIAVLAMALIIRFFNSALSFGETYVQTLETSEVTSFNAKLTQYNTSYESAMATIYDIISLANYAYDYNSDMVLDPDSTDIDDEPGILRIDLLNYDGDEGIENLQNHRDLFNDLIKMCYYIDNTNPTAGNVIKFTMTIKSYNSLGKINHVEFQPYNFSQDAENLILEIIAE